MTCIFPTPYAQPLTQPITGDSSDSRKFAFGRFRPNWLLSPGKALIKNLRRTKCKSSIEEVDVIEHNPSYAHARLPDGREDKISVCQLVLPGEIHDFDPQSNEQRNSTWFRLDILKQMAQINSGLLTTRFNKGSEVTDVKPHIPHTNQSYEILLAQRQRTHSYILRSEEAQLPHGHFFHCLHHKHFVTFSAHCVQVFFDTVQCKPAGKNALNTWY